MRTLIVLGVVAFGVGLAAHWLPRALGGEPAAARPEEVRTPAVQSPLSATRSASVRAASAPVRLSAPQRREAVFEDQPGRAEPAPDRTTQLISAGFTRERAQEILRREAELRRAAFEHEYAATGTIRPLNTTSPSRVELQMRSWMGDPEYERYLRAIGQATRVRVADVEPDSVAANAGILSGDEILSYAGRRVFSLRDLNALMLKTSEGETVATTVVRDGHEMELYVTGGALGISPAPGAEPR
jgi:hypothetical protein